MYHGYVPGVVSLQVMRDGVPKLVIVPFPLRTGAAGHAIFCLFSSMQTLFEACLVMTGKISGK